ncbi:MAG: hypothetical protein QOI02_581 [Actinomycetota bacterium]|jgi:DNA-binding GntR family transcriptional regulator|nr:transcriptional regulator, GntR family [Glaciihabitans sp.]MDQ1555579.1 hypothetical protein [Actinomycetota bacterium]
MTEPTLHERLRQAILSLDLAPGQRLSERGLEPEFGASRTPIRAALMRLESEGLVRRDAKGWIVTPLDLDEIATISEFREVLEVAGVRLSCERASSADLEAAAELARAPRPRETPEESIGMGTSFHLELAKLSGNLFLVTALDGVLTRLYRTRWLEVTTPESRARTHVEHEKLARALIARDADAAELAILEHLRGGRARLLESLAGERQRLRASGVSIEGGM